MKKALLLFVLLTFSALGSTFGQEFWERIYTLPDSCNRTYDIATNAQGDIFVATNKGLYKSSDYAETWESVWQEGDHYCTALDIAPNGRICVGSNTDHLCFSDDNGLSWESVNIPHGGGGCTAYRVKYFGNDTLFALPTCLGSGAYVDYSFDGGDTWNYSRIGNWALDYATDVTMTADKTFYVCLSYMGNKGVENRPEKGGVFKSHDCTRWEEVEISNSIENCYSVISSHPKLKRIIVGDCAPLYSGKPKEEVDGIQLMFVFGCLFLNDNIVLTTGAYETGISFDGGENFSYCSDDKGGNRIIAGKDGHLYSSFYSAYSMSAKLCRSINTVDDLLKVTEGPSHEDITVFPNPATDEVQVCSENCKIELKVYSSVGFMIDSHEGFNRLVIDVSRYHAGVYLFHITSNNRTTTQKIIVK